MSRVLQGALHPHRGAPSVPVGAFLAELGDKSFGWAILFFALINMIPAPYGSTLITAPPLILLTAQLALGYRHLRLPGIITRRRVSVPGMRRLVVRLRRLVRPLERFVRPRRDWVFTRRNERLIGIALCTVSLALFLPMPLTGFIPAFALLISALALVERDGTLMLIGLGIGAVAIMVTLAMLVLLAFGAQVLL